MRNVGDRQTPCQLWVDFINDFRGTLGLLFASDADHTGRKALPHTVFFNMLGTHSLYFLLLLGSDFLLGVSDGEIHSNNVVLAQLALGLSAVFERIHDAQHLHSGDVLYQRKATIFNVVDALPLDLFLQRCDFYGVEHVSEPRLLAVTEANYFLLDILHHGWTIFREDGRHLHKGRLGFLVRLLLFVSLSFIATRDTPSLSATFYVGGVQRFFPLVKHCDGLEGDFLGDFLKK